MIYFFRDYYFTKKKRDILQNSKVVNQYISSAISKDNLANAEVWLEFVAKINKGQAWLISRDGNLISSYPLTTHRFIKYNLSRYKEVFTGNVISKKIKNPFFDNPMLLTGIPIKKGFDTQFALLIFTPVSGIKDTINKVVELMIYSSLMAVIMAVIISYTWSRNLSQPLKKISDFTIQLSKGDFGRTINEEAGENFKELGTLTKSINQMSLTLKKTIQELTEEKNKLDHVLSGMEEGVLAVNAYGDIILANNSALKLVNSNVSEVNQEKYYQFIRIEKIRQMFEKVLEEKEIYTEELFLDKNNLQRRILLHLTPVFINNSTFWGVVGLFQDISERWRFEKLQKQFVANVSHDLKTPLSSIRGATELLLDGILDTPEKRRNYLQMIYDESNRLENLLEEVLELDVFDTRVSSVKIEKVDIKQLIATMKLMFEKIMNKEEIILKTDVPDKKIYVKGNVEKLKRILLNLLDNACKFSDKNKMVELGVKEENNKVKIWVKDNGIGIPAVELENIWERFYKVDKARTPDRQGSGLGLAIVKNMVEAQGGSVFVESKINEGSTFGFYLKKHD